MNASFLEGSLDWEERQSIAYLTIEHLPLFRKVIAYLNQPDKTKEFYIDIYKEKLLQPKEMLVVTDIFNIASNYKIKNIIEKELNQFVLDHYYAEFIEYKNYWNQIGWQLSMDSHYDIIPTTDLTVMSLIKMFNFQVNFDDLTPLEVLMEYLKIATSIGGVKLNIIANLTGFLSANELKYIIREAILQGIPLLLIESSQVNLQDELVTHFVIDDDLCEF